ncbi:MAG: NADH:ubiquinone oxidoreductase subunit NDUFA12 [Acetobacteraceae bacterium]
MDRPARVHYIDAMNLGTLLFTLFRGRMVGRDDAGNRYYEERRPRPGLKARRWVLYAGRPEASDVPSEWHGWLHYTMEAPLLGVPRESWQKPHLPNLTGTPGSYRPPGHDYEGGQRAPATGDYDAWSPGA